MSLQEPSATLPQLVYQWQEGVEDLGGYQSGGYHPTHIGDQFNQGRYQVVHKLGHGSYSTVWLAKDWHENRYVALKILVAEASQTSRESQILRALASKKGDHLGRPYVSSLLEEFFVDGPNGRHLCIVSEAAGCSIAQSKEASLTWKFPLHAARSIAAQVLLGLDYTHSCGVVHGDLHSNNILLQFPSLGQCTVEELYERLGEPQKLPVERLDKLPNGPEAPRYCVPPAMIFVSSEDVVDPKIIIADFGEAFFDGEERTILRTPITLLPPELFFHEHLGPPVDIWTLGCTLYEILGERPLFEGFMPDQDDIIAEMISTLGSIPKKWWEQWSRRRDFFLEDGSWEADTHRNHAPYSRPLSERMRIMGRGENVESCEFSPQEMAALEKLLRAMLTYNPAERITSGGAVASEWMERWGLPAIQGQCNIKS